MASSSRSLILCALSILLELLIARPAAAGSCYPRIFSFGDSLADTGNIPYIRGNDSAEPALHPPYGETYFHHATGRFSDGRLIIDFIADAVGMPFLRPYLAGKKAEDFTYGANFAVGGATALSGAFFRARGVPMPDSVYLGTEMEWFKALHEMICSDSDCTDMMGNSLFFVGEIGGNDYNIPLLQRVPFKTIRTFVPSVIGAISSAITELIGLGAKTLVVPGNLPCGCIPSYLTMFKSRNMEDYEPGTGCLKWLNEFSKYHNSLLLDELDKLRTLHPNVTIIYADYFGAAMEIFLTPHQFGFKNPLFACCGSAKEPYGCSPSTICGGAGSKVCDDPLKYASWDGFHPSEAAYKAIAIGLLRGSHTHPPMHTAISCPQLDELRSSVELKVLYDF